MKVVIAGSRSITDRRLVFPLLDRTKFDITEVVCGCAKGVDSLGRDWARRNGIHVVEFPADWERYGKRAGMMRNVEMLDYADALIAIWDGVSKGTAHSVKYATKHHKPVEQHNLSMRPLWK